MTKISPLPVARYAGLSVVKGFDTVLRLGWAPVLVSTTASLLVEPRVAALMPKMDGEQVSVDPMFAFWLIVMLLVALVTQTIFAVAWHRNVALGEARSGQRFYLRFGKREAVYALIGFVLGSITMMGIGGLPIVASLLAAGQPIGALFILAMPAMALFLLARLCLMLPMVALGQAVEPARAWQMVDGNSWRVVAVLLLIGIPIVMVEFLLISVFGGIVYSAETAFGGLSQVVTFVAQFVSGLVMLTLLGIIVSALSLIFMILGDDETLKARLPAPYDSFVEPSAE